MEPKTKRVLRKYSNNFKIKIVKLMLAKEEPIKYMLKRHLIYPGVAYGWLKKFKHHLTPSFPATEMAIVDKNNQRKDKDVRELLMERISKLCQELEALKAALAILEKIA